ncbi:acyl-CoA synthetase [Marinactinospora thermotolerans]|uniref:Fatty-acyl-CoA synthase n=1 Tax=Marinactinospora thermotolerans DSM 45154 TaxID=1122192 RepID=A0A1T4RN22_9ACTN|nr:acyl-CoA synthetase [Marinactinospora thermotolerans]SKA17333.1 fatty-acyl-CoA synthase [Marinactinospora thermotolerans DSM 45154]
MTEKRCRRAGSPASGSGFSLEAALAAVAAAVPWRTAVISGERRVPFVELDERAGRFARHLREAGVRPGEHVAILAFNRVEWLEAAFGAWRAGAVPVNVNYRYVAGELRHVLSDADVVALVAERSLVGRVAEVRADLPRLRHVVLLEDGSPGPAALPGTDYETALATARPAPTEPPRTCGDDLYLLYTGGTTGYPKGVMWRQEDLFHVALERRRPGTPRAAGVDDLAARARSAQARRMLVLGPLMHAAGQWNALSALLSGLTVVLNTDRRFVPERVVALADREAVHTLQCVGDAMARPIGEQLLAEPHRCPELTVVTSGGTPLTPTVREIWRSWRPGITLNDSYGGSETGVCGASQSDSADTARRFTMGASVAVLDDALRPLPPGSPQIGRIARTGRIPLGYYNDPVKTAETFPVDAEGRRWAMSGDFGTVAADGSITLLGRGSAVINTGGEKVYPEEVESVLKAHPDIDDTIVVSAPDERLGQRVAAVVALAPGRRPSDEQIRDFCRARLAGFKVPRRIHVVAEVKRTAVGKQDYRWAAAVARGTVPSGER